MPKLRYFLQKIRQVLGNPLLLDPRWPLQKETLLPNPCVVIHSYHYIKLYKSAHIAIKSQFQSLVFMIVMAIQTLLLILFCQRNGIVMYNRNVLRKVYGTRYIFLTK